MTVSILETNKCILTPFIYKQNKLDSQLHFVTFHCFLLRKYHNLAFEYAYQHPLLITNSKYNQYFTNKSTHNRSVSTSDHQKSKTKN